MLLRVGAALISLIVITIAAVGHTAGWQRLADLALDDGRRASRDTPEDIALQIRASSPLAGHADIAASVTEAGHWRLVNRAGEPFTASGSIELARALATLAPEADKSGDRLRVLLDGDTVFHRTEALRDLPARAELSVLVEGRRFGIARPEAGREGTGIVVRPGMLVDARNRAVFLEVLHQLERPLARDSVRMVALEPGGTAGLTRAPVVEHGVRHGRPDVVDPGYLADALGSVDGQIVVVSGRLAGNRLIYKPGSGPAGEIPMETLKTAVRASDANLVLLDASSARQPGTRNWLWQRIALSSAEKALGGATLGEFLRALAGEPETLIVRAATPANGRIDLMLEPLAKPSAPTVARLTQVVSGTWSSIVSETAGSVSVRALRASMLTVARQGEIDRRIIPGIPYAAQVGYLVLMGAGLLAFPIVNAWWRRIWPSEVEGDYHHRMGYALARAARGLVFVLFFVPAAGLPALFARLSRLLGAGAA